MLSLLLIPTTRHLNLKRVAVSHRCWRPRPPPHQHRRYSHIPVPVAFVAALHDGIGNGKQFAIQIELYYLCTLLFGLNVSWASRRRIAGEGAPTTSDALPPSGAHPHIIIVKANVCIYEKSKFKHLG